MNAKTNRFYREPEKPDDRRIVRLPDDAKEGDPCPKCKEPGIWRESCDVGVGTIYGPFGCGYCGWSEDSRYDVSDGPKKTEGGYTIDQFGGATPPGGHR